MNNTTYRYALVVATGLFFAGPASGQQATEVYVPLGQSPGVSISESWTGLIHRIDYEAHRIEMQVGNEMRTVKVDGKTRYYIDRSKHRRKNSTGSLKDCQKGQKIEAWIVGDAAAEWIKIETG